MSLKGSDQKPSSDLSRTTPGPKFHVAALGGQADTVKRILKFCLQSELLIDNVRHSWYLFVLHVHWQSCRQLPNATVNLKG